MGVRFFDPISIPLPREKVYSRLGYTRGKTKMSSEQSDMVEHHIQQALSFIDLKGAAIRVIIESNNSFRVVLKDNIVLESNSLAGLLKDCQELLVMGSSAGNRVIEAIGDRSSGSDVTAAVVFDAVASEMADEGLNWIMSYFDYELRRQNLTLTKIRFSAGYQDFALNNQNILWNILQLKEIGVKISKENILIPEKSVIAVAGIKGSLGGG